MSRYQLFGYTEELIFLNRRMHQARREWAMRERALEDELEARLQGEVASLLHDAQRLADISSGKIASLSPEALLAELDDVQAWSRRAETRIMWGSLGLEVFRFAVDIPDELLLPDGRYDIGRWIVGHNDGTRTCEEFLYSLDSPQGRLQMWTVVDPKGNVERIDDCPGSLYLIDEMVHLVPARLEPVRYFFEIPMMPLGDAPSGWDVIPLELP